MKPPLCLDEDALKDVIHERLLLRREVDNLTECWVYTGAWQPSGLGIIAVGKRRPTASRAAAWVYVGGFKLDDRRVYVMSCPKAKACFNPEHLRIMRLTHQPRLASRRPCVPRRHAAPRPSRA